MHILAQTGLGSVTALGEGSGAEGPALMTFAASAMVFLAVLIAVASIGLRIMHMSRSTSGAAPAPNPEPWRDEHLYCPKCGHRGPAAKFCQICGFNFAAIQSLPTSGPPPLPTLGPPPVPIPSQPRQKSAQNAFWPTIHDEESARQAASQGMWGAFFCSGATMLAVFLTHSGLLPFAGITDLALLDAGVFAVLGMGIRNMSRTAAVLALGLYIIERIGMVGKYSATGTPILVIIGVMFCFVNAVRGTFAYHNLPAGNSPEFIGPQHLSS